MKEIHIVGRDYTLVTEASIDGFDQEFDLQDDFLKNLSNAIKADSSIIANRTDKTTDYFDLFEDFNGEKYFGGYIGTVSTSLSWNAQDYLVTIQINSRFDSVNENYPSKPYFLMEMLSIDDHIQVHSQDVPSNDDPIYAWLMIYWFRTQLLQALSKGFYRNYQQFNLNNTKPKGRIDVPRHIQMNVGLDNGCIAYSYRERSVDNPMNRLILATYRYMEQRYPLYVAKIIGRNEQINSFICYLTEQIGLKKENLYEVLKSTNYAITHPYYTEYETLRTVCRQIICDGRLSFFGDQTERKVKGVLFYVPDLWEKYIKHKLFRDDRFLFESQVSVKVLGEQQKIRPDFVFYRESEKKQPIMVLDAKFKPKWGDFNTRKENHSLGSYGLLGDFDKCIRDMVSFGVHKTGVIFPSNLEEAVLKNEEISDYNICDEFYMVPVLVPEQNEDFETWRDAFADNFEQTLNRLEQKMKNNP